MNVYRTPFVAPTVRGPRWIRRRALRVCLRIAALAPLVLFIAAHELDDVWLEIAVIPLLPAMSMALLREFLRWAVTTVLRATLPRKHRPLAAPPERKEWRNPYAPDPNVRPRPWDGRAPGSRFGAGIDWRVSTLELLADELERDRTNRR